MVQLSPSTPGKGSVGRSGGASKRPLIFLIIAVRDTALPEFSIVLQSIIPNHICVGDVVVAARVVFGLSLEVGQARRMG